ncbi:MAG: AmmeMemoRadiSam system protein A [Candidatus Neomarinimicrobiota bacterium]|jgi:AmmeMemoRadiSam system protein A|nr:AmmeMemoRadiSam system protein A [Candidatus Neomarinimicrobiota bacterium]MDD3965506.1 AmmeMemoRadiSam system protein A [Candidatus Neomarinimicrobiota bacterium]MDX9781322.1 AmmeMemoRadiSam system protein A [bacterium]
MTATKTKNEMLCAVRAYLRHRLFGEEAPLLSADPVYDTRPGLFVTLHKQGELRGCIGYIEGVRPLSRALYEMADAAAFRDPRFSPLQAEELEKTDIEISLLSPLEKVDSYLDIEIGKHGIIMKKGMHQAVFLPQVAPEQGWDLKATLRHLSLKAGLPVDSYLKPDCRFFVFTAEVFSENEV